MAQERFDVSGMTCSACSSRVGKAVSAVEGVRDVTVNLLKNSMNVDFDETRASAGAIILDVEKAGYEARLASGRQKAQKPAGRPEAVDQDLREMKQRLVVSFLFTIPLFFLAMGPMIGMPLPAFLAGPQNALAYAFTQFLLTVPVMAVNAKYYRVGFKTLFSGAPNMDSLIAIGSGAATLYSVYAIYKMAWAMGHGDLAAASSLAGNLYFDSAAMILALITLGKFFEARAKGKTSDAIARLMDLAPQTATVLREGRETLIPREEVLAGDILVVKAGESLPVDGVITEGSAFIDESAITGESLPLEKQPGDAVTGATINTSGHFLMRATRVGDDTTLAQIVRLVDEATSSKAPIARLADRISGVFVPVVIAIAVLAAAAWLALGQGPEFALSIGIAVLVISCPCALGLATPTAIMVGTGRGAANGILLKSAEAIETAQAVDTVVLDKTGTVTEGRAALTDLAPAAGVDADELLTLAASLEKLSEHPLGAAIVRHAEEQGRALRKVADFTQIPGQGIAGNIEGVRCMGGNVRMLEAEGLALEPPLREKAEAFAAEGKTALYFARDGKILGLLAVADTVKESSARAVAALKAMGIDVVMITGDNAVTAAAVQRRIGVSRVIAEVLPQDKEREIRAMQERGRKVAMVGDGVNDAPALARADVGIAIGAGTDVAIESADIVLMKSDLMDAVTAIQLSRAVMRTIRQNLFWAFFYNSVGIPVAAGVFYKAFGLTLSPMIAAAAMSLSSVSVVGNALRLRFFTPPAPAGTVPGGPDGADKADPVLPACPADACPTPAAAPEISPSASQKRSSSMKKTIDIQGMNCGHCSASVEKALAALPGVQKATVDLAAKKALVEASDAVTDEALKKAVTDAGFTVTGIA